MAIFQFCHSRPRSGRGQATAGIQAVKHYSGFSFPAFAGTSFTRMTPNTEVLENMGLLPNGKIVVFATQK
ncbi:MAG: hypothetical protein A3H73_00715 [Candidatus Taylorbacteria bacterium RIFCSPLOWO2_02_FULL_50_120]|nr:MAG: hypothetical protein A2759_00020 [Candidatus Taylorbacteria bacterium RIFCSPHIGHO2_01_FULL_49_60]OHA41459.1 MAG: hypothetical protein A3H73_00715 [Candidatus Taylorbacteria bacterium RIFCSPLOWO2_02_FULL_50_120]OHA47340.1 MAG: hypothetical protein A3G61_04625 [Candidatus Taylorbacteria bacterium RIFCSPLOWO2_12_FULL_49_67]